MWPAMPIAVCWNQPKNRKWQQTFVAKIYQINKVIIKHIEDTAYVGPGYDKIQICKIRH